MPPCVLPTTQQPLPIRQASTILVKSAPREIKPTTSSRRITARHRMPSWVAGAWQRVSTIFFKLLWDWRHTEKLLQSLPFQCTVSCGGGQQVRMVRCMLRGKPSVLCSYSEKPPNIKVCNSESCSDGSSNPGISVKPEFLLLIPFFSSENHIFKITGACEDTRSWCHLVPRHNTCSRVVFRKQCCKSCRSTRNVEISRLL